MTSPSALSSALSHGGEECRYLISDLCTELEDYLPRDEVKEVYRAYLFGAEAHEGQSRMSGEPYIYHPLAVTRILSTMHMDYRCLMAAILHDVIEDTPTAKEQLCELFGVEVAELVDGVSKLTHLEFESRAEAQAANFRKMLLAMNKDIRVILIKLADRLHNMRTLGAMPPEKRRRIARETLEIYAPIASRLGINQIRMELEDLGFAAYWPMRYKVLDASVRTYRGNRTELVEQIRTSLITRLEEEGIPADVGGREKHLYGIYSKMLEKRLSFSQVMDVFAFRIVVDKVDTCYRVLGAMHSLYRPVPGKFKDYIAIPKANGYQSLHTILKGPGGLPMEIQIRTEKMHQVADAGVAAHWKYKEEGDRAADARADVSDWLKNLVDLQQGAGNSIEFLEHVKVDLFPDEVYVFTPNNEIKVLSKGATVIDFAYAVHSDVGHRCVAARIDHRMVPLRTRLRTGQTVEVITKENGRPNPAWLNFVVTARARAAIRAYLKNLEQEEAVEFGRELVEQELRSLGCDLANCGGDRLAALLVEWKLDGEEQLFKEIGLGNRAPLLAARFLVGSERPEGDLLGSEEGDAGAPLILTGGEGMVVNYARCCHPIPGDSILASFSPGKGMVVHRRECRNIGDPSKGRERWLGVEWSSETEGEFSSEIAVSVENQRGALASIAAAIAEMDSNIENVSVEEKDGRTTDLRFLVSVRNRKQLAGIIKRLRHDAPVLRITRIIG
jgi:GTP pyrophosphokinase